MSKPKPISIKYDGPVGGGAGACHPLAGRRARSFALVSLLGTRGCLPHLTNLNRPGRPAASPAAPAPAAPQAVAAGPSPLHRICDRADCACYAVDGVCDCGGHGAVGIRHGRLQVVRPEAGKDLSAAPHRPAARVGTDPRQVDGGRARPHCSRISGGGIGGGACGVAAGKAQVAVGARCGGAAAGADGGGVVRKTNQCVGTVGTCGAEAAPVIPHHPANLAHVQMDDGGQPRRQHSAVRAVTDQRLVVRLPAVAHTLGDIGSGDANGGRPAAAAAIGRIVGSIDHAQRGPVTPPRQQALPLSHRALTPRRNPKPRVLLDLLWLSRPDHRCNCGSKGRGRIEGERKRKLTDNRHNWGLQARGRRLQQQNRR
eukprot:scaffold5316_cov105-Isochrysis_galbana.AAC.4